MWRQRLAEGVVSTPRRVDVFYPTQRARDAPYSSTDGRLFETVVEQNGSLTRLTFLLRVVGRREAGGLGVTDLMVVQ